ncbi:hypothetical protein [Mycolicibacterium chlorophenolicum]|uniref:hypothetical protein n=1 Tax=Mycolicibacterium chlorophenolicum TaxID=37916 RepID=UPI0010388E7B|nr:hypothetical protein [Mycolicibacterium chlorophenolicum]
MQTDRRISWNRTLAREYFAAALKDAVELGQWPDPRYLLNADVGDAVGAVADSFPQIDQSLVAAAERTFATYLERHAAIYGED